MADAKISALPNASTLGGTEQLAGVQSSANVNITPAQIKTYCGTGTSALWQSTSYTTTIPLDSLRWMPEQSVAGATTFTIDASPAAGASCYVVLIADGANVPTFTGMKESGYSAGYNNTAGIENEIIFWYDGAYPWYSVSQEVNASPVTNPTVSTATTTSLNTIDVTFTTSLNTTAPATSAFALTASGGAASVTGVSISGSVVTLTLGRSIGNSETLTLAYTQPGSNKLQALSGGFLVANFSGQSVTDAVNIPVLSTAAANAPTTIALVYDRNLSTSSVPATSAYALTASGGAASITNVAIATATVTLTVGRSLGGSETLSLDYTQPGSNKVKDNTGVYLAANLSSQSVANNIGVAPTVSSAQVANANPNIIAATFSGALNGSSVPATTAFAITASGGAATVSSVGISGSVLNLTLNRNIAHGETVTFAYTVPGSNKLQNSGGGADVAAFSGQSVTNNVSPATTTIFSDTLGQFLGGTYNIVSRVAASAMTLPGSATTSITVTTSGPVASLFVGQAATSGDPYDAASLTRITFGGSNGTAAASGSPTTSDTVSFSWDGTSDLVFSQYSTSGMDYNSSLPAGDVGYYKSGAGDDSATTNKTGYNTVGTSRYTVKSAVVS